MKCRYLKLTERPQGGYWLAVEDTLIRLADATELASLSTVRRKLLGATSLALNCSDHHWTQFVVPGLLTGVAQRGVGDFDLERDHRPAVDRAARWECKLTELRRQLEQYEPGDEEYSELQREIFWAEYAAKNGCATW